ncbi:MAG: hypothetical protein ACI8RZ_001754 [Myxococcota bacterium]|jgi:hypothetical protein
MGARESEMRRMLPVIQIVGLLGCDPAISETPTPPPEKPAGNPPPPEPIPEPIPGPTGNPPAQNTIIPVALSTIGELNAQSLLFGRVYTLGMGKCGVDVPLPPDAPQTSGIFFNISEVDCPAEMLSPAFQECRESLLSRTDAESCVCTPVTGNPPPGPRPIACPG